MTGKKMMKAHQILCLGIIGLFTLAWETGWAQKTETQVPGLPSSRDPFEPANDPVVRVVQQVLPTVVNIYTEGFEERKVHDLFDEFFERWGQGAIRGNRIARIPVRSLGSGLLVHPDGFIVTNHHVVERASQNVRIKVILSDRSDYEADLIRADEDLDLALIKIRRGEKFPYLDLSSLSPNLLGQPVVAIGNPVGYESSVSRGILSAKGRTVQVGNMIFDGLLQTDAAINPGNSGGPLIDLKGRLVGINSVKMGAAQDTPIDNIGFAIPGEKVRNFVEQSIAIARGERPEPPPISLPKIIEERFGLVLTDLTPALSQKLGVLRPYSALWVQKVQEKSAAAEAGIEPGMLVAAIGGVPVRSITEIPRQVARVRAGQTVDFTIRVVVVRGSRIYVRSGTVELTAR